MATFVDDHTAMTSDLTWTGTTGQTTVVTYSFETVAPDYLESQGYTLAFAESFMHFTAKQRRVAEKALDDWASVSGLQFVEVPAGEGDIRFGNYDFGLDPASGNASGYAYLPNRLVTEWWSHEAAIGGDVFIDLDYREDAAYYLLAHEIGHALGFEHSHEGDIRLNRSADSTANTVMSYNATWRETGLGDLDDDLAQHMYGQASGPDGNGARLQSFETDVDALTTHIVYGSHDSSIMGTSLDDLIEAGAGDDTVAGFGGDDTLLGEQGDDVLIGGTGDDLFEPGAGDDRVIGGIDWSDPTGGIDSVSYAGVSAALRVDLQELFWTGSNWANAFGTQIGQDTFFEIDNVIGGAGNDTLAGSDGDNLLHGGSGRDSIIGGAGADTVLGQRDNDTLAGGDDADRLSGGEGDDVLRGDAGADTLNGGRDDDTLTGGTGDDRLTGSRGFDIVDGGDGSDKLSGGADDDTLSGDAGADRIVGGTGNDDVDGGADDDTVVGGSGDDALQGGGGNDRLKGHVGSDTLDGGAGDDLLDGGADADQFVFSDGYGHDEIRDFDATDNAEKIDLRGLSVATSIDDVLSFANPDGADVVFTFAADASLRLNDVSMDQLDSSDFLI